MAQSSVSAARKRKRAQPENQLQLAVCRFLRLALPKDAVFFFVNNGHRNANNRMWLARLGAKPGIPDLCIVFHGRSIFVELKSEAGSLSKAQEAMHEQLVLAGAIVHTVRTMAELEGFLSQIIPLHAKVLT